MLAPDLPTGGVFQHRRGYKGVGAHTPLERVGRALEVGWKAVGTMCASDLPEWMKYAQALSLGPAVVAVIAAFIAGGIQYRQWRTAHDKYRLDLFDKRLKIIEAARPSSPIVYNDKSIAEFMDGFQKKIGDMAGFEFLFNSTEADALSNISTQMELVYEKCFDHVFMENNANLEKELKCLVSEQENLYKAGLELCRAKVTFSR